MRKIRRVNEIWEILQIAFIEATIGFCLIVLLIIFLGNMDIAKKEKKYNITSEPIVMIERLSVEEGMEQYINTLPIPEQTEISETKSIYEEEMLLAKEEMAQQEAILKEGIIPNTKLAMQVSGMEPTVRVMNTTAYCSCEQCCDKTDGITATGEKTTEWYTVAAGPQYEFGTIIYIPSLSDKPNGGWFVVQDRGGAISNENLDIYFDTHEKALQYGRKNQECYIFEF